MALVVGPILVIINQGAIIYKGEVDWYTMLKIMLTLIVPYTVSTFSSVLAIADEAE